MSEITAKAQIIIHRPAAEVFEAFADPEIMTRFWFPRASGGRLEEGKEVTWYVGTDEDAYAITVRVKAAREPDMLRVEWGEEGAFTDVEWTFEAKGDNATVIRVCESGFPGGQIEAFKAALDSTGGFNQVITAAKALLEYGVRMNVVEDHVP